MFKVEKGNIYITRGDMLPLSIEILNEDKTQYVFKVGDVIGFKVIEKDDMDNVILEKQFTIEEDCEIANIKLLSEETKIGKIISQPVEYWYEIQLNPNTENTNTIIGYTKDKGAPLFVLLPEGGDKNG